MGPVEAITTCLRKSFRFSGRASRSEFWWFAPIGVALPVAIATSAPPKVTGLESLAAKLFFTLLAAMPIVAAAGRRFQDTGLPAHDLWIGLKPTVVVLMCGWLVYFALFALTTLIYTAHGLLIGIPAFLVLCVYIFFAPATLGATLGQLLLPSDPGPNRYGPNPIEVTP